MRRDVQLILKRTAYYKQVMMFTATLSDEVKPVCLKFMHDVSYFSLSTPPVPFLDAFKRRANF